ncbi:MAG TPA: MFS transporter [Bacilli bacterium]|nr:MFS transporter [Bacilli bacterium]
MSQTSSKWGVFANRWFSYYFLTATLSKLGSQIFRLALPWLILEKTGSVAMMSVMWVVEIAPFVVLGPFLGVFIDHWDRRKVMLWSDFGRAVLVALIPILLALGALPIWSIFVVGFLLSIFTLCFDLVADFAMLPQLVRKDQLTSANSIYMGMDNLSNLLGPAVAGVSIALLGAANSLYVDAISYFLTLLVVYKMPIKFNADQEQGTEKEKMTVKSILRDVQGGFSFIFRSQILWVLALVGCLMNLAIGALYTVMTFHLGSDLHLSSAVVGTMYSMMGVAALIGSFLAPRLLKIIPMGRSVLVAAVASFGGTLVMALVEDWRVAIGGYAILTIAGTMCNIYTFTVRQREIPSHMMGRVNSAYRMILTMTFPISALIVGGLATVFDAKTAFIGSAVLMAVVIPATLFSRVSSYREQEETPESATAGA